MSFWRESLSKAKRDISRLRLTEFDQTRFDAAMAWVLRSRAGIVILNVTSLEILTAVKLLKKIKGLIGNIKKGNRLATDTDKVQSAEVPAFSLQPAEQEKPRVLIVAEVTIPQCLHYRVMQKVEQLERMDCYVEWHDWSDIDALRQTLYLVDVVLFYRVPGYPRILELMQYAKALQKIVVYDVDDLVFDREQLQKKFQQTSNQLNDKDIQGILDGADLYKTAIETASYGIASTPALQEEMSKLLEQRQCYLLPNGLDHVISDIRKLPTVKTRETVTLFYGSGTKTHDEDFATIALPLSRLMTENDHVKLAIIGHLSLPSMLDQFSERIQRLPLMSFESFLHCLKHADIAIAPLEPGKFADCKSEIKWLEAACFSVPSVVAKTQRYVDVIAQGETGFVADNEEEWFSILSDLVNQPELRKKIGQSAQHYAEEHYGVEAMAGRMQDVLKKMQSHAVENGLLSRKSAKKRLLFVNVLYPPQAIGGATTVVSQSVQGILDRYAAEFDVSILTTEMSDSEPYTLREYEENGVRVTVIKTPFHAQLETRECDHHVLSLCQRWYQKNRPDIIHFHSVQRLTAGAVEAAKLLNIPYFVTVHDAWWLSEHQFLLDANNQLVDPLQVNPFNQSNTAENASDAIQRTSYLTDQLRGAQLIIAVSEYQASLYSRNGFQNVEVIQNGVSIQVVDRDAQVLSDEIKPSLVVGYLGGISAHKGYDFLKTLVEESDFEQLSFKVVDLFKPYGFSDMTQWGSSSVEMVGKYSSDNIAELYQEIDVLVAPSIWPESFGLVTREAALRGVWVIAADAGGMAEDIIEGKTGFVFPMNDKAACKKIFTSLQTNVEKYKSTQPQTALSEEKIVSMDHHVDQLVELYRKH